MFEGDKCYGGQNRAEQAGAGSLGEGSLNPEGDIRGVGREASGGEHFRPMRAFLGCQGTKRVRRMNSQGLWGPDGGYHTDFSFALGRKDSHQRGSQGRKPRWDSSCNRGVLAAVMRVGKGSR